MTLLDNGDGSGTISKLANNDALTLAFRAVVGVLAIAIAVVGYLGKQTLDDIRDNGRATLTKIDTVTEAVYSDRSAINVLTYRIGNAEVRLDHIEDGQRRPAGRLAQ